MYSSRPVVTYIYGYESGFIEMTMILFTYTAS